MCFCLPALLHGPSEKQRKQIAFKSIQPRDAHRVSSLWQTGWTRHEEKHEIQRQGLTSAIQSHIYTWSEGIWFDTTVRLTEHKLLQWCFDQWEHILTETTPNQSEGVCHPTTCITHRRALITCPSSNNPNTQPMNRSHFNTTEHSTFGDFYTTCIFSIIQLIRF